MSNNKMLVDATHPEETRVVVLRNGRVEEFDYESAARKLLRGNIYLAKVTRVEPALQAAFVDYGGNRHGFLAFNEIHPDYYQIPMADRQALLDEEAAAEAEEEAAADARAERLARRNAGRSRSDGNRNRNSRRENAGGEPESGDAEGDGEAPSTIAEAIIASADDVLSEAPTAEVEALLETAGIGEDAEPEDAESETGPEPESIGGFEPPFAGEDGEAIEASDTLEAGEAAPAAVEADVTTTPVEAETGEPVVAAPAEAEPIEQVGSEDALEELPSRPRRRPRSYKIQEVIKRRQIILVQVVKEERGNKGAALTTYLSLAGRYTVLMPNTARGGGISRKITNPQDRKRLKAIAAELEVPEGMGLIIRTAGAARTKQEIKRDFEYLLRLWESVRDLTLNSQAPSLVYEEGNLIKRSIRDLYNKDVEEIVVAGEEAHREAKDFMRMLMPSHVKHVIEHKDPEPVFARYRIEQQLNAMFSPYVTLRSGGYLVINQTEALVAVDVNSGKSTREFSIEETALNTNLEAADEIARQVKLRDLAGLIVIDFIDMEEKRNNRAVERRLKDALRFDRARIQLGHISHFGLMEMSRQRLRTGVLEGSTSQCPHCQGTGIIRSTESIALAVLRGLEDALMAGARTSLIATTTATVALYILNQKRAFIADMEHRYGLAISVQASEKLAGANFTIEKGVAPVQHTRRPDRNVVNMDWGFDDDGDGNGEADMDGEAEAGDEAEIVVREREDGEQPRVEGDFGQDGGRRRRRRRRRGRRGERQNGESYQAEFSGNDGYGDDASFAPEGTDAAAGDQPIALDDDREYEGGESEDEPAANREEGRGRRGRRRGRRGGRRGRDRTVAAENGDNSQGEPESADDFEGPYQNGEAAVDGDDISGASARQVDDATEGVVPGSVPVPEAVAEGASEPQPQPAVRAPRGTSARAKAAESKIERVAPGTAAAHGEGNAEPAKAPDVTPEPAVAEPAPAARQRSRGQPTAGEVKIERVVVRADNTAEAMAVPAEEAAAASEQPARKGWWQRKFGGE